MMLSHSTMWKVTTKLNKDGNCEIEGGIRCGYCERCKFIYNIWRKIEGNELDHEGWAKRNFINEERVKIEVTEARRKLKQEIEAESGKLKHEFWTIALPKDYDLFNMVKKTVEMQDGDMFKMGDSIANFEYYSKKNPEGGNLHIHVLVCSHGTYKPVKKIEMIAKHFGIERNFVDKAPHSNSGFENRLNYVLGRKIDLDKRGYCDKDKQWRDDNGLPEFTCYLPETLRAKYSLEEGLN